LSHSRDAGLYIAAARILDDLQIFVPRQPTGDWPTDVRVTSVPCTGSRLTAQWMRGLGGLLRQFGADVIHVHNEPWSLTAQRLIRLRTAVVIHGGENLYRDAPLMMRVRRAGTRRVLAGASGYLNWGQTGLRAASDAGLPASTPRGVIPGSPPDPGTFAQTPMPAYDGELRLAFVGRLVAEKGLDTLIAAMAAQTLRGRTHLTVVGTGPESQDLQRLSRTLQVSARFVGELAAPALHEVLARSHAVVVPSRDTALWSEQWGRVAAEAMMSGRPVITSDAGELPALVGPGQVTFHQNDAHALAERLQGLLDHPDRLQEMADDAYRRSWNLHPDELAVRLIAFWQEARRYYEKRQATADGS
jgi:glycosyltransferase involved in cell wall biosynthesis